MESPTESPLPPQPDSSGSHGSLRADTTAEQDRKTAGQRNVNIIWELTQAFIAIYFVRMNHTKQGGIGGSESRDSR
jgi:hypothetical protein